MKTKLFDKEISNDEKLFVMAGPCVIESEKLVLETAETLKKITEKLDVRLVFKSSFDKANRTSINSFRGLGMDEGLRILRRVKEELGIPVVTDIHLPQQAQAVAEVADVIQIPAFLCRQTDLLVAAAQTGRVINVKKAQFLAPADMKNVAEKIRQSGNDKIMLCERGTSFGYNNLVVDMTGLIEMKTLGYPVIFDATHSVQEPGGLGDATGGNSQYVIPLTRAAVAIGIAGLFFETHPNPCEAKSDGPNMVPLSKVEELIRQAKSIDEIVKTFDD